LCLLSNVSWKHNEGLEHSWCPNKHGN